MKTLTVPSLRRFFAQIEAESRERKLSKSNVVRERLSTAQVRVTTRLVDAISNLIGSIVGLPADLSARKKQYLKATGYGQKRPR